MRSVSAVSSCTRMVFCLVCSARCVSAHNYTLDDTDYDGKTEKPVQSLPSGDSSVSVRCPPLRRPTLPLSGGFGDYFIS